MKTPLRTLTFLTALALVFSSAPARAASGKKHHSAKPSAKTSAAAPLGPNYSERSDAMQAAQAMATRQGLDPDWVRSTLGQARYVSSIAKAMEPPAVGTPKNWTLYRSRFVEPKRIQAGLKFWQANREALQRAEQETGVPAAIVVGVIGVETIYGQQTGNYRVIDALSTLAFDFPTAHPKAAQRSAFFLGELEAYLALTHRTHTDPLALRGSYAGAMGLPQFMPSSWTQYAVDFDGDGRIDLFHSNADVIGSVAHYFQKFQWRRGMPTHYPVAFDLQRLDKTTLLAPDILPTFSAADMQTKGVVLAGPAQQHSGPLALVELQNGAGAPLYIAGTENFYAITRYNWSSYYALAVIELGQAIQQALQTATPATASTPVSTTASAP